MDRITITDDLRVSPIGLGTANFGTTVSAQDSCRQLDRYVEAGNLIDTAHVYGDWVPGERGRSERTIGKWLAARGGRDRVLISTKGAHPRLDSMDCPRVSPVAIQADMEDSLHRLRTDYIDLYFLHRDDPSRPVGESLECLEQLRRAGKIRYYGCSNWTLPRIIEAADYAHAHGLKGFVCNQLMWSLAAVDRAQIKDRTLVCMDAETYRYHRQTGMAAMAYMSIAGGYFAHRNSGDLKEEVRARYALPINDVIFRHLTALSETHSISLTMLSLLYFASAPFPAVALASFSGPDQLEECVRLLEMRVEPEVYRTLDGLRTDLTEQQHCRRPRESRVMGR